VAHTYAPTLVVLSALIAVWASYAALRLARRAAAAQARARRVWLIAGALAMGIGIWSMHFVGMLALRLPVPVNYSVSVVALSLVLAIAAAAAAFSLVSRDIMRRRLFWAGGAAMGLAISGMHYTGMAAMRLTGTVGYDAVLVLVSFALAYAASFVALRLAFRVGQATDGGEAWAEALPALLMGGGIVGMHYTAMAAAHLGATPLTTGAPAGLVAATSELATVVTLGTAAMLGMAELAVIVSRRETQVREREDRLRLLAARIQSAREEERSKIAREIHDELGQALTILKLDLGRLRTTLPRRAAVTRGIVAMTRVLDRMLDALHRLATDLRPPLLDQLGLQPACRSLAREFETRTRIRTHLEIVSPDIRLDADLSTAAYRIVQEALTNVARHAGANRVDIRLFVTPEEVTLEVCDDGRGISAQQLASPVSLGLLGMRERARSRGGDVHITGTPGRGTVIRATLPQPTHARMVG
jgi:signal transduction histidine kinase